MINIGGVIVKILAIKGEATWDELKQEIKKRYGINVNPNTLAFHINKLIECGIVKRIGNEPRFKLVEWVGE